LTPTPVTRRRDPGSSVAATRNGAAEEDPLGVVAGRDALDHGGGAVRGVEPREQDARLHLGAGDLGLVPDRPQRAGVDPERQLPAGRLHARPHPHQRIGDPSHRTGAERLVADELELPAALAGEDAREQPGERAGVSAVDRPGRRLQAAEPGPGDPHRVSVLLDANAERAHGRDRRLGVGRAPEAGDDALALRDRAHQHGAVGDRLVARDRDASLNRGGRLDPDGTGDRSVAPVPLRAHRSSTAETETP
jgi:hypothetical protein